MNHITAEEITSFGRKILTLFIDGQPLADLLVNQTKEQHYQDLWSAWLLKDGNEAVYLWSLLQQKAEGNIPVLLCPDDMDFWCTVITAQVHYHQDTVVWEKIGRVTGSINLKDWIASGLQDFYNWSAEDWTRYGDTLAYLEFDEEKWSDWLSQHWSIEEAQRLKNYFGPYFNTEENIDWLFTEKLTFPLEEYERCLSDFRSYSY